MQKLTEVKKVAEEKGYEVRVLTYGSAIKDVTEEIWYKYLYDNSIASKEWFKRSYKVFRPELLKWVLEINGLKEDKTLSETTPIMLPTREQIRDRFIK